MSFKQKKFYQKFPLSKAFWVPPLKLSSPGDLLQTVSWLDKIFSVFVLFKNTVRTWTLELECLSMLTFQLKLQRPHVNPMILSTWLNITGKAMRGSSKTCSKKIFDLFCKILELPGYKPCLQGQLSSVIR